MLLPYKKLIMTVSVLKNKVTKYLPVAFHDKPVIVSPMKGLSFLQSYQTTVLEASVYEPCICLILQGRKETCIGNRTISFGAGESLIVSHSLPVVSRITEASTQSPYIAMVMSLDLTILRSLSYELDSTNHSENHSSSLNTGQISKQLIDALSRYLDITDSDIEKKVLSPILLREIHFRLLTAPHANMLRELLQRGSYADQISKSISYIKKNYKDSFSVSSLANRVGMSESLFYKCFKQITETTPLQYQKDTRLIEAQILLRSENMPVSSVAYEVGYNSPNQFSREYSRKFGTPPREELTSL